MTEEVNWPVERGKRWRALREELENLAPGSGRGGLHFAAFNALRRLFEIGPEGVAQQRVEVVKAVNAAHARTLKLVEAHTEAMCLDAEWGQDEVTRLSILTDEESDEVVEEETTGQ